MKKTILIMLGLLNLNIALAEQVKINFKFHTEENYKIISEFEAHGLDSNTNLTTTIFDLSKNENVVVTKEIKGFVGSDLYLTKKEVSIIDNDLGENFTFRADLETSANSIKKILIKKYDMVEFYKDKSKNAIKGILASYKLKAKNEEASFSMTLSDYSCIANGDKLKCLIDLDITVMANTQN